MSEISHFRSGEPLSPTIERPFCTESDLIVARMRNEAKGQCVSHSITSSAQASAALFGQPRFTEALDQLLRV